MAVTTTSTTCKIYNRQGTRRRQCIDDYGPTAAFSNGVTCADCSKYKHLRGF